MTAQLSAVAERMSAAAAAFLGSLEPAQRLKACLSFPANDERQRWYYTPTEQGGLPLVEMLPHQQHLAHQVVGSGLSRAGYATAATIIGLENALTALEGWRTGGSYPGRPAPGRGRDPNLYFLSVFGEPESAAWGWRFGGHHLSLHYTVLNGRPISATPSFFGADPADTDLAGGSILRPLGRLEDLGRELLHALDGEQRARAVLASVAPPDLVTANRPLVEEGALPLPAWELLSFAPSGWGLENARANHERYRRAGYTDAHAEAVRYSRVPKGLPASAMTPTQRAILTALLHQFTDRLPEEAAVVAEAKVSGAALEAVHFAWAGSGERRQPHYYRLQGPQLLVEYDNSQRDANHIHTVWRDPAGDFGGDLLAQHYATAH